MNKKEWNKRRKECKAEFREIEDKFAHWIATYGMEFDVDLATLCLHV